MCRNRIVHFASCSTLDVGKDDVGLFLRETGASAVSGYSKEVDWVEAATFDVLYLKQLQFGGSISLTRNLMRAIRDGNRTRWGLLERNSEHGPSPYHALAKHLGFRLEVAR